MSEVKHNSRCFEPTSFLKLVSFARLSCRLHLAYSRKFVRKPLLFLDASFHLSVLLTTTFRASVSKLPIQNCSAWRLYDKTIKWIPLAQLGLFSLKPNWKFGYMHLYMWTSLKAICPSMWTWICPTYYFSSPPRKPNCQEIFFLSLHSCPTWAASLNHIAKISCSKCGSLFTWN